MAILTVPKREELEAFAAAFDLGNLRSARGIEAGTVNTSYVLELGSSGTYFLRMYEEQGPEGARAEAGLLQHLASPGSRVPTPRPIADRAGVLVQTIAGKPGVLFPWVEGEILCQKRVTPEAAHEAGAALARIHLAGPAPGFPLGPGRFGPPDLVARCARVAASKDPEAKVLASSLESAVQAIAARRDPTIPSGLVHGDLFRDNVLWQGGRIAALLDFESAHHGPFAYDVAVTVLSWAYSDRLEPAIARGIVEGYRTVREIEPAERIAIFDETILATLRFTITRITDEAIRVGKKWQRFVARREAVEALGRSGFAEILGL